MSISPEINRQIGDVMCNPVGTLTFEYSSNEAFKKNAVTGVLINIPAKGHYFRVDRTPERVLRFFHSSPGTGTRVASISLEALPDFDKAFLAFTWSPEAITFACGPRGVASELLTAKGFPSSISFRIGSDGNLFQIGDEGVEVMGLRFQQGGQRILSPTALETWDVTIKAVEVLLTGKSEQGFMFEVVQTSAVLSMLVTGLENYAKNRLIELDSEGIDGDYNTLFVSFVSKAVRDSDRLNELKEKAITANKSVFAVVMDDLRINFQNYKELKRAYSVSYGIKLGEIGINSQKLIKLQDFIRYRHRVVHVSPLLTVLNEDKVPPDKPVFANQQLGEEAVVCFKSVIEALHNATLSVRP